MKTGINSKEMNQKMLSYAKTVFLGALLFVFLAPFIIVLLNSFKTTPEFLANPVALPKKLDFSNYIVAFEKMKFARGFVNSLIITVFSVAFIVLFSSMTAHLFVRKKWKINQILFLLMIASMIIPFQAIMIPLVKIYGTMKMLNNKWMLIYMYIGFGASMAIFIYHGFIKSIPIELEEAAMIDGCTPLQAFFMVVFPLLKPTTVTIIILDVLWIWNDFLLPNLVLMSAPQRTLPLSTFYFFGAYSVDYARLMAGLMMTMLPVILLYMFLQKYIIKGVVQGSIK